MFCSTIVTMQLEQSLLKQILFKCIFLHTFSGILHNIMYIKHKIDHRHISKKIYILLIVNDDKLWGRYVSFSQDYNCISKYN